MGIAAQDDLARAYAVPDGIFYIDLLQPPQGGNGQIHARSSVLCDHNGNLIFAYALVFDFPALLLGFRSRTFLPFSDLKKNVSSLSVIPTKSPLSVSDSEANILCRQSKAVFLLIDRDSFILSKLFSSTIKRR